MDKHIESGRTIWHKGREINLTVEQLKYIESKIDKSSPNGCWIWQAALREDGYIKIGLNDHYYYVHRIVYLLKKGPIPDDKYVLHNCPGLDNRACVNPNHLWLGTLDDNNKDRMRKGRNAPTHGEFNGRSTLTNKIVIQARIEWATGKFSVRELADKYGVSTGGIWPALVGKTWTRI